VRKNSNTYQQIEDANDSILSNMDEGWAQQSDDGFKKYLYYSKGSVEEVIRRLKRAARKRLVDQSAVDRLETMAQPLGKQFGGFIKYLSRCGFKDRGHYRLEHPHAQSHSEVED